MYIEEIGIPVSEQSNPSFSIKVRDESGQLATPVTMVWDLSTMEGALIAYQQNVSTLGSTSIITLTTAQTRLLQDETVKGERLLTIHATYNSSYGNGLVARKQIKFTIEQFALVGYPIDVSVYEVIFTDDYPRDMVIA